MDALLKIISGLLGTDVHNYVVLEDVVDEFTFVCKDQSLMTLYRIEGIETYPGAEEITNARNAIRDHLEVAFGKPGHSITWGYQRDESFTERDVSRAMEPARKTARIVGLDVDDIVSENIDTLSRYCVHESNIVAIWTHPSAVEPELLKEVNKRNIKKRKNVDVTYYDSIDVFRYATEIYDKHISACDAFETDLKAGKIRLRKMEVHEAGRVIRGQLDRDGTSFDYRPVLHGDKLYARSVGDEPPKRDASDLLWPRLDWQLGRAPHEPVKGESGVIRVGDTYYATLLVDLYPQRIQRFGQLLNRITADIPWRMTFHMRQGMGLDISFKAMATSFLAFAHSDNKLVQKDVRELLQDAQENDFAMQLRTNILTWSNDIKTLRRNYARLSRQIQGWGGVDLIVDVADPSESYIASAVGATYKSTATASYPTAFDAATMLPFARPAGYWEEGAVLFKTEDGKLWPYQPGSSKQTTWIDLVFASPGQGKSVLSQAINFALCLRGGLKHLPYISIIDIGPSSKGLIDLLRARLPEKMKHLVLHKRLRLDSRDAINVFDTQLGMRFPLPLEREFQKSFLTILTTPIGRDKPHENMGELIGLVVDEAYRVFADPKTARRYSPNAEPDIHKLVEAKLDITLDRDTTWWDVVDGLFHAGYVHEAALAQRHAVPVLTDLPGIISSSQQVRDQYGESAGVTTGNTGEALASTLARMIGTSIKDYPNLASITRLDLSQVRVCALDLQEVASGGGPSGDKQTAIMYMLARHAIARDFYLLTDYLDRWPKLYRAYQDRRIREIRESDKRLVFDEFHRTAKSQGVREQVERDIREGRKWGVQIALLSQEVLDFTPSMVKQATNVFILGGAKEAEITEIHRLFGLSKTELSLLRSSKVHGPKAGGSAFLLRYETKDGAYTQLLKFPKGGRELWAYSTTQQDASLRAAVVDRLGHKDALTALAVAYPGGSAQTEIERRMNADIENNSDIVLDEAEANVIQDVAEEVVKVYQDYMRDELYRNKEKDTSAVA